jgi:hypothetical protein
LPGSVPAVWKSTYPGEQTLPDTVAADPEVYILYDQYIALLRAHGLIDPKFDENEVPDERRHF